MTGANTSAGASPPELSGHELDALREVANIGAAHAATALSTMLGATIMISVPRVHVLPPRDVGPLVSPQEEPVVSVLLQMLGDLTGQTLLVFPSATAHNLVGLLLRREQQDTALNPLAESALSEVGNILSSAYMNALSDFFGMLLLPSPPQLSVGSSASVVMAAHAQAGARHEQVFCVESELRLTEIDERLRAFFVLLPDPASLEVMLRAIHRM